MNLDLRKKESIKTIKNEVKEHRIDVIIAGPPCQGFSLTGTEIKMTKETHFSNRFFELAKTLKPKFLVIENITGTAYTLPRGYKRKIISAGKN